MTCTVRLRTTTWTIPDKHLESPSKLARPKEKLEASVLVAGLVTIAMLRPSLATRKLALTKKPALASTLPMTIVIVTSPCMASPLMGTTTRPTVNRVRVSVRCITQARRSSHLPPPIAATNRVAAAVGIPEDPLCLCCLMNKGTTAKVTTTSEKIRLTMDIMTNTTLLLRLSMRMDTRPIRRLTVISPSTQVPLPRGIATKSACSLPCPLTVTLCRTVSAMYAEKCAKSLRRLKRMFPLATPRALRS
mmetsp:Transcript_3162/g.6036  ORF Transcript_3162/g.6036 Transcript_3162/m.6036 type:complete len:247 (+) Transcript_3162:571-1311(+)